MIEEVYQPPEANLENTIDDTKRPMAITVICIIGFLGALVAAPLVFSEIAKSIGAWYPFYLGLSTVIGLVCFVGMWQMRKIAVFIYAGFVGLNQIVMLATGIWSIGALLIPGVIVALTFYYSKTMK